MSNTTGIKGLLVNLLSGIDEDTVEYFQGLIVDSGSGSDLELLKETMGPFLESYGFADGEEAIDRKCQDICNGLKKLGIKEEVISKTDDEPKLLDKVVVLSAAMDSTFSESEQAAIDALWGFDSIRDKKNETIELTETGSAKFIRKVTKDQKKWLEELESKFVGDEEDDSQISTMLLPDLSGNNREKDILVNNVTITYGGSILLESGDLRFAYGRRYGLVGRNGVGKTTLLKHIANFEIEGFPRHHRVLHVKQEVRSSDKSVLQVVLDSDIERTQLMTRYQELMDKQEAMDDSELSANQDLIDELANLQDRLDQIGAESAESRAASILSGLQFTEEMQAESTSSLSGGWLMRVSLACALYIEPDLLMLDEPTNHLDLEAVIWLQTYLLQYPHTVIVVSHDRAFLNDVCTDIILFKEKKLVYYKGNYDTFEAVRGDMLMVQHRQHEAQAAKLAHMQEFVDRFRYNANRAALVQSRIKAMNKEMIIDDVEDESEFQFQFFDAGSLGANVIQIEGVSFGYLKPEVVAMRAQLQREQQLLLQQQPQTGEENTNSSSGSSSNSSSSSSSSSKKKSAATAGSTAAATAAASAASSNNSKIVLPPITRNDVDLLFADVHLNIDQTSRVALVGPNGAGKSTLLNLIRGTITPIEGVMHVNPQLRIGVFTQHHLDSFDLAMSPVQNMMQRWPKIKEDEFRAHLGRFEITGNDAIKPMKFSSGGQKSRVAFACLTFAKPHVLLMDEPTNHLDMNAIEALISALQNFNGGVMVISHDQHFITSVCKELWVVGGERVVQFRGTFNDYKALAIRRALKRINAKKKGGGVAK